ncbi:unnamed protein product, partial [Discosporangium mesarthrocarpum]
MGLGGAKRPRTQHPLFTPPSENQFLQSKMEEEGSWRGVGEDSIGGDYGGDIVVGQEMYLKRPCRHPDADLGGASAAFLEDQSWGHSYFPRAQAVGDTNLQQQDSFHRFPRRHRATSFGSGSNTAGNGVSTPAPVRTSGGSPIGSGVGVLLPFAEGEDRPVEGTRASSGGFGNGGGVSGSGGG